MKSANQCVIIVVDDEVNHLNLLQMRLLALGFKVEVASNGVQALQKLRDNPGAIDLIITDFMMPGLDGIGLLQTLRNDPQLKNIPLIAMTGFPEKNLIDQSLKYGVTDILLKPFPFDELLSRVRSLLSID